MKFLKSIIYREGIDKKLIRVNSTITMNTTIKRGRIMPIDKIYKEKGAEIVADFLRKQNANKKLVLGIFRLDNRY